MILMIMVQCFFCVYVFRRQSEKRSTNAYLAKNRIAHEREREGSGGGEELGEGEREREMGGGGGLAHKNGKYRDHCMTGHIRLIWGGEKEKLN